MAPIVVATVYDPSDGTGDAVRLGLPVWPAILDLLAELNQALRMLAREHGALVADVHARFLGHGPTAGDPAPDRNASEAVDPTLHDEVAKESVSLDAKRAFPYHLDGRR